MLFRSRILSPNTLWKSCHVWCLGGIYSRQTPRTELLLSISQRRAVSEANALLSGRWLYFVYSPLKLDFPLIAIGIL